MKRGWLCWCLAVWAFTGCVAGTKSPPAPTPEMANASGFSLETLERGHGVYLTQCGGCHELFDPTEVKVEDWRLVVPGMCWNAGLDRTEEAFVTKYLVAVGKP